jgi:hypothetical protein
VKQSSRHLLLLEMKPPRQLGFTPVRKETRDSEVRKAVERDLAWNWLLVGNSNYLNGDAGITCGDSKLWQTNHCVHPLVCLLMFLLSDLLE